MLLFETEQYHLELRVTTIVELAKYSFYYLADSEVISRMEAEMAILNGEAVPGYNPIFNSHCKKITFALCRL